ncbi:hypothetical protein TWF718_002458 [Orbilia javanica]|uniref:F-box domain-containing protein n=1 Tax=Orbilia javanica TaxID=47235 RepID=A0AAN8RCE1_9PEZI
MEKCPNEVIGLFIEDPSLDKKDIANFALVSRRFKKIADRVLYRVLKINIDPLSIKPKDYLDTEPTAYPGAEITIPNSTLIRIKKMIKTFHENASYVRTITYCHESAKYLGFGPDDKLFAEHFAPFHRLYKLVLDACADNPPHFPWVELLKGLSHLLVSNPNLKHLTIMHKPSEVELSQDVDFTCINEVLRQGTVVELKYFALEYFITESIDEPQEGTWGLTEHMITILEGCTDNLVALLLDYVVPLGGVVAGGSQGNTRKVWSLPSLECLVIHYLGKTVGPLSDICDAASLSNVKDFRFLSPICQKFGEVVANLRLLVKVERMNIHILNLHNWAHPLDLLVAGDELPVYNEMACFLAAKSLGWELETLQSVSFVCDLLDPYGVLLLTYDIKHFKTFTDKKPIVPAAVFAIESRHEVTEDRRYLGVGNHLP